MTCAINSCMYTTFILMALVLIAQASYFVFSVLTQFLCLSLTSLTFLVAFCVALVASLRAIVNWNSQRLRVLALFFVLYAALQVGMFLAEVLGVYGSGFVVWEKGLYVVISFSSCIFLSLLLALAIFLMWRKIIEKEKLCDTAINEGIAGGCYSDIQCGGLLQSDKQINNRQEHLHNPCNERNCLQFLKRSRNTQTHARANKACNRLPLRAKERQ
eukprot:TRINITY_DN15161_c0_g1_i14.p1 TRINITY_DN15161_c0_g1~~TRINITY_DN15161_c0_g1_i14.p1  ORF type:complete len:215 (+),score=5.94 TRINITY_DN15161_c0_g1_i14:162-806(+)